jgi:hypothetical protein
MKRYLLFAFDDYYPCGGWKDYRGNFDSIVEALESALRYHSNDNYQVVDSYVGLIVSTNVFASEPETATSNT